MVLKSSWKYLQTLKYVSVVHGSMCLLFLLLFTCIFSVSPFRREIKPKVNNNRKKTEAELGMEVEANYRLNETDWPRMHTRINDLSGMAVGKICVSDICNLWISVWSKHYTFHILTYPPPPDKKNKWNLQYHRFRKTLMLNNIWTVMQTYESCSIWIIWKRLFNIHRKWGWMERIFWSSISNIRNEFFSSLSLQIRWQSSKDRQSERRKTRQKPIYRCIRIKDFSFFYWSVSS